MSDEQYKVLRITRDDLLDWIDKPPSNADIELADYLVNALDNQRKYYEENAQLKKEKDDFIKAIIELAEEIVDLKSVLKEIRDCLEKNKFAYVNPLTRNIYNVSRCDEVLEIIDKGIGEDK